MYPIQNKNRWALQNPNVNGKIKTHLIKTALNSESILIFEMCRHSRWQSYVVTCNQVWHLSWPPTEAPLSPHNAPFHRGAPVIHPEAWGRGWAGSGTRGQCEANEKSMLLWHINLSSNFITGIRCQEKSVVWRGAPWALLAFYGRTDSQRVEVTQSGERRKHN